MGKPNRAINEDMHDLLHMMTDAKRWFDRMDKKLEEIMLRQEQKRKDD